MKIEMSKGLPFVSLQITYTKQQIELNKVLLDTGSCSTIISSDRLHEIGLIYEPNDKIRQIRGVGGTEFVFTKELEQLKVDNHAISKFPIEVGLLDYGFELEGILGMDYLIKSKAIIDLASMKLQTLDPDQI